MIGGITILKGAFRARFDPLSGIGMSSQTVSTMLVWLVICMTGWLGHIGNTAHVMGLVVGAGFGYAPQLFRRMKR